MARLALEAKEALRQVQLVKVGEATRIRNKRFLKINRTIFSVFDKFNRTKNLEDLLRFSAYQADELGISAITIEEMEYD